MYLTAGKLVHVLREGSAAGDPTMTFWSGFYSNDHDVRGVKNDFENPRIKRANSPTRRGDGDGKNCELELLLILKRITKYLYQSEPLVSIIEKKKSTCLAKVTDRPTTPFPRTSTTSSTVPAPRL